MNTDPIADMLTRIRNAGMTRLQTVEIPSSNMKERIAGLLKEEGYIHDYHITVDGHRKHLVLDLKYGADQKMAMRAIRRISKPGRRQYAKKDRMPKAVSGLGIVVVSTSKGIMTDRQAQKIGVGGEVICEIW